MVDTYQIVYEYSAGNSISFKSNDMSVDYHRLEWTDTRVDGTRVVTTTGIAWRTFSGSAYISGNTMDTLDGIQTGAIVFTGDYPRLTVIYWDGDSTETNVEVRMTSLRVLDKGQGWWLVAVGFEEKDQ